ncbi:FAD binding domain-containing protein [Streptomyces spiralis]|uniref:FAD binding domain-containing protein n=1 Tax=Streptomyces spiralis TaxID=66376 RepID=UPI00367372D0
MSTTTKGCEVLPASSVDEAVRALADLGDRGAALAAGTWVTRSSLRGEDLRPRYVSLNGIAELRAIESGEEVSLGALTTHTDLASRELPAALAGLVGAAGRSAFPQVRNVATLGGNIGATGFAEADLVPALLALDARLETASLRGRATVPLGEYLPKRAQRPADEIVVRALVAAPATRRSAFARLTVRGGGEYAIANVCVCVDLDPDGVVTAARVAIGSVEPVARLSHAAADALVGNRPSAAAGEEAGRLAAADCTPRDGLDAPGWYRREVLPSLVRRACAELVA